MTVRAYARLGVVLAGIVGLGIELAAERLLAPAFGTTNDLWSIVIGLTFAFLSLGYAIGGRLADRHPTHRIIALCLLATGVWTVLLALAGRSVVDQIQQWTFNAGGLRAGLFLSVLLLITVPPFLLGIVTPTAIRLVVPRVGQAGSSAGTIYALGTIGSLVGTFVPVIVLMPRIGVRLTFLSMAAVALLGGAIGLTRLVRPLGRSTPAPVAADSHNDHRLEVAQQEL
ncbi:MAG TPA: fused MFS/spermidine synthase [Thermomicrobiales bacterium]|nr:fused MFS/spermidine synthase [Thermomicrobiales bacterium]